ncbi:MAG: ribbon-helix-helix protein, CopG family [Chloroflexota bacterium]
MTERLPSFDHLSPEEREVVGDPSDWAWEEPETAAPARRARMTQFSLRLNQRWYDALQALAQEREVSFSDIAREAIESYLGQRDKGATPGIAVSTADVRVVFHGQAYFTPTQSSVPNAEPEKLQISSHAPSLAR